MRMAGINDYTEDDLEISLRTHPDLVDSLRQYIDKDTIIIQPSSSTSLRSLSGNKWCEIIKNINDRNYNVGILDAKSNQVKWDFFINTNFKGNTKIKNLSKHSHDINCASSFVSLSSGVIGVDSALTHISAALKVPTVGIYGPFKSELISKYYTKYTSINPPEGWNECGNYSCGLTPTESYKCPYIKSGKSPGCMETNKSEFVVDELFKLLAKG